MALRDQLRTIVVDDMSTSRGLITQSLESLGVNQVETAASGQDAIKKIAKWPVHLVISDMNMPEMNGLQLLQTLRTSAKTQKVGFILITGLADKAIIDQGKRLGMNNFVKKPFTTDDLRKAIEQVVGRL